ncbi:MAG: GNAT family N-acetyltransferase, partial [Actinomycetes bacterium]
QGAGYVPLIGVKKHLRGRGIARALLLTAFSEYQQRGCTGVQLGVDTGNATGAIRLYESVGMTSLHSAIALGCTLPS